VRPGFPPGRSIQTPVAISITVPATHSASAALTDLTERSERLAATIAAATEQSEDP